MTGCLSRSPCVAYSSAVYMMLVSVPDIPLDKRPTTELYTQYSSTHTLDMRKWMEEGKRGNRTMKVAWLFMINSFGPGQQSTVCLALLAETIYHALLGVNVDWRGCLQNVFEFKQASNHLRLPGCM